MTTKVNGTSGTDRVDVNGLCVQRIEATPYSTYSTDNSNNFPLDNTIPQNTEGGLYCSVTITPKKATNRLVIRGVAFCGTAAANNIGVSICDSAIANAIAATTMTNAAISYSVTIPIYAEIIAGSTVTRTYQLRVGTAAGTLYMNGNSTGAFFGGVGACRLSVEEYQA